MSLHDDYISTDSLEEEGLYDAYGSEISGAGVSDDDTPVADAEGTDEVTDHRVRVLTAKETDKTFAVFKLYLELGPHRSLDEISRRLHKVQDAERDAVEPMVLRDRRF